MNIPPNSSPGGTVSPIPIESLVHSNPASPNRGFSTSKLRKPSIDVYFPQVAAAAGGGSGGSGGSRVQVQPQARGATPSPVVSTSLRTPASAVASGANASGPWIPITRSRGNTLKRYRDVDDVGRVDDAKRMYPP